MIIALLSWYDERPDWLYDLAYSLRLAGVTHLCALDGAYSRLPGGAPDSPHVQREAISGGSGAAGIGVSISTPPAVWQSEMEKRTALFDLGRKTLEEYGRPASYGNVDDWFLIVDADEFVHQAPDDLQQRLSWLDEMAADVRVYVPSVKSADWHPDAWATYRKLFRALPDLHVTGRHYGYRCSAGNLWGPASRGLLPAAEISDFHIVHRQRQQDARRVAQLTYYRDRDAAQLEHDTCDQDGCSEIGSRLFSDDVLMCRKHAHLYGEKTGTTPTTYT